MINKEKKAGKPSKYDAAFKIAVAREYLESDLGFVRLGAKYGIPASTLRDFVKWYQSAYPTPEAEASRASAPVSQSFSSNDRELLRQLEEARLKIAGLETMIEIANKELGIDIGKKSGTKQSLK
jgi:transposase-like protein